MTDSTITVREAGSDDLDRVETLLRANDLPHRDVRTSPARFFVASAGETFVGVGGFEPYGSAGLLRSIVIAESGRGRGYGTALCDALEDHARTNGVEALYLLTTTASEFFRRRGYRRIEREEVPESVRETTEFGELCPASATCMRKDL